MKSENKLRDVIAKINQLTESNNLQDSKNLAAEIKKTLQEFIIDNSGSNKRKFNMFNYTANDPTRPYLSGICYDTINKCAVATEAHIIVVDNLEYDPTIENKFAEQLDSNGRIIIDKYGNKIDGKFPENYMNIFPDDDKFANTEHMQISVDELNEYINRAKAYIKTNQLGGYNINYRVNGTYFDANMLLSFLVASEGNIALAIHPLCKFNCAVWYNENRRCLLMPRTMEDDDLKDSEKVKGQEEGLYLRANWN